MNIQPFVFPTQKKEKERDISFALTFAFGMFG